ncbi:retrovirus-related pol polyprotein from transposon TNT 1-94 [Tanacetum coccineum]|uniref:Retrovirus-related pol polyprotein from transposon TNT 1-94 n=1 Tax=Tanacetum coccineum TaxID=301880 RepID=A0ABQ5I8A3_9ASTR
MENLNEVRVKELRNDNGTKFRNHKLEAFYDEKGISQNFSSPCTHEPNGVAERRNRTLIEATKTMLNSVNLPKQGISPDINYFYVFGCPWLKLLGYSTSKDKKWKKPIMLLSVKMKQSLNQAQRVMKSTSMKTPDDEFLIPISKISQSSSKANDHPVHNEVDDFEPADDLEPAEVHCD